MEKYKTLLHALLFGALLFAVSGLRGSDDVWKQIPLPKLGNETVTLRVVYAENPRIAPLSSYQIRQMLHEAERIARRHFQIDLNFEDVQYIEIEELFDYLPEDLVRTGREFIYDFKNQSGDNLRVKNALVETLRREGSVNAQLEFARPYLLQEVRETSFEGLADALLATMLERIEYWKNLKALDGQPLLDESDFNEYIYWSSLGYGGLPYDVIITNQPIISIEYAGIPIHSTLRGGITVGNTDYNRGSELGSVTVLSSFAFTLEDDELKKLRNGANYSNAEAMRLAGAYLTHEIGHQLFHFGHPFGNPACVMTPAQLLDFRKWYWSLDAQACPIGSSPYMEVGGANELMLYNEAW